MLVVLSVSSTGCYFLSNVETNEIGVDLYKNEITKCLPAGNYSKPFSYFAKIKTISLNTLTFSVDDPEVATADNQLVSIAITVQARRKGDCESVRNFFTNWSHLANDEQLTAVITATVREGIKVGTRQFTLTQLLDDRNGLSDAISTQLEMDAGKYSTEVINITIENIGLAPAYADLLQEKALLTAEIERELRRQDLIKQTASNDILEQEQKQTVLEQQLLAEQAQTAVDIEIASREGKKTAAANQVYLDNPAAYELERLARYGVILGDKSVIYFLESGTNLSLLFGNGGVVPVATPE